MGASSLLWCPLPGLGLLCALGPVPLSLPMTVKLGEEEPCGRHFAPVTQALACKGVLSRASLTLQLRPPHGRRSPILSPDSGRLGLRVHFSPFPNSFT